MPREMDQVLSTVKRAGDKNLPLETRQLAYSELISFSKSDSTDIKKLVGRSIPICFENFTSLQEDAVDAVYDLCEDADMDVRIVGYKTFAQISRNVHAWVKRNTDVLIQLLQVETPEELTCIRDLLLKHIRISAPPALAVIIDNLCSSESDDKKKETLLDILEVEGRSWIKKECMEPTSSGEENENGKLLREGLEQVLRSNPPSHLLLKIYTLLAPLPHTSSTLPTSLLLLKPSSKETYLLAFSCFQPPDTRAVILNWYEGGGGKEACEGGEVEETREFCRFVKKWWEEEKEGGARGRGAAGVLGEGVEWEVREEEVRERWRRVEDGLVSMLAVRVVGYWKQATPSQGRPGRPIPVPLMEPLLMTLAYLSETPNLLKSQITSTSLEFCRHLFAQPEESSWKAAIGAVKKLHDNYYELLAWFRSSRQSSGSKPPIPLLTPSWQFITPSSSHRDSNSKDSRRTLLITSDTTYIDPPPRASPSSLSIPRNPTNGSLASRLSENGSLGGGGAQQSMAGGEDRKRKFAVASGGASELEKPGKRIAAPQGSSRNGRTKSTSPLSDMDGIEALPGRPTNFPSSSSTPSLLNRISSSSTTNGHASRPSPIPVRSSSNSSFSSSTNLDGSSSSNSHLQESGRVSPLRTSSFIPGPPPHLQPAAIPPPAPTTRTSTFNIVPNPEIRHPPSRLARQLSSSNSLSSFTASRLPPLPPPPPHPTPPAAPATSSFKPTTFIPPPPTGPRTDPNSHQFLDHFRGKQMMFQKFSHLPFHPNYNGPPVVPPPPGRLPFQPPPRIIQQGPDLISSFGSSPAPTTRREREEEEEQEANPNKGLNVRGRAKARAPPAPLLEPEPEIEEEFMEEEEERWEEEEQRGEERYEDWGGDGRDEEEEERTTGRGLLGRMS